MVRHIIMWNYKDGLTKEENKSNAKRIKRELENLVDTIDGIIEMNVVFNKLSSSTADIVLNSLFIDEKALEDYQDHPDHVKAAQFVRSVTQDRKCVDYIE